LWYYILEYKSRITTIYVVCDIEADQLEAPKNIWTIVCRDVSNGALTVFREPQKSPQDFLNFARGVKKWIGHNFIQFDGPVLAALLGFHIPLDDIIDTLVLSRLINFNIEGGHSLAAWGERYSHPKSSFDDFSRWSQELEDRCILDTEINLKLYQQFAPYLASKQWASAIAIEHKLAWYTKVIHENGIYYNLEGSQRYLGEIKETLETLEKELTTAFPLRPLPVSVIEPKLTQKGTLGIVNLKWLRNSEGVLDLTPYSEGAPFTRLEWETFNPGSSKQRVERLWEAGWKPTERTKTHIDALRQRERDPERLAHLKRYGWKTSEVNLATLPPEAPEGAKKLAQWLILRARHNMLVTWETAYKPATGRLHPSINHIGSWTHRCSHNDPNGANIPSEHRRDGSHSPYGKEMRALWGVPANKYQVGTDAAGIQARIFAHYLNSPDFIEACVNGTKEAENDIHYLNWKICQPYCKSRNVAKTFYYAWILGAGLPKIAEIFGCTVEEARLVDELIQQAYPGYADLKQNIMPRDQNNGYFIGFDGRAVLIPEPRLLMAGYLQNGESQIMKYASEIWNERLTKERIPYKWINFVHDEWQTEVDKDLELCHYIGMVQSQSIVKAGENLGLICPQDGEYKIGTNWFETHADDVKISIASGTSRGPRK
jgi:DNA polymerase-1